MIACHSFSRLITNSNTFAVLRRYSLGHLAITARGPPAQRSSFTVANSVCTTSSHGRRESGFGLAEAVCRAGVRTARRLSSFGARFLRRGTGRLQVSFRITTLRTD